MIRKFAHAGAAALILTALAACTTTTAPTTSTPEGPAPMATPKAPPAFQPMPSRPLDPNQTLTRIGFGSCLKQEDDQSIWNTIAATQMDAFLFIGDNVYGDNYSNEYGLPELKKAYATLGANKPFAALRAKTPVLPVWDDHDYGRNDAGASFPQRQIAERLFENAWALDESDPRRQRDGVYHAQIIGDEPGKRVQIILLDTRFFRSDLLPTDQRNAPGKERFLPDTDPGKTMLGEAQWRWLKAELEKPADVRLLVSSIQVIADGHGWEAWRTLPLEREKLYDTIGAAGAESIILLSGDRHAGAIYKRDLRLPYPLYEITSTSLNAPVSVWRARNNETGMEAGPYRVTDMYYEVNFGMININWQAQTIDLQLLDADGKVVRQQKIDMDELRPVY